MMSHECIRWLQDFMRSIPDVQYVPPKTAVVHTGSSAKLRAEVAGLKSQAPIRIYACVCVACLCARARV